MRSIYLCSTSITHILISGLSRSTEYHHFDSIGIFDESGQEMNPTVGQAEKNQQNNRGIKRNEKKKERKYNAGGCGNNETRSHVHSQYTVTCLYIQASTNVNLKRRKGKRKKTKRYHHPDLGVWLLEKG